ncbi:MAG: hypothetical protein JXB39_04325 [Deltaproteobacteria bacterium]|nr:hypothetical protein [Deltaproteobacteria bacterium]
MILLPLVFGAALAAPALEDGVVTLKVTWQSWEVTQPWVKTNPTLRIAQAVVVKGSPHPLLLTTAQMVAHATHIRASKHGEPGEAPARVLYEDREANLALVAVDEPSFFDDLDPIRMARRPSGDVQITRWRNNQFETSRGRVSRALVAESATGVLKSVALRVQTDIQGGGWSEPVFSGRALAGLSTGQTGSDMQVLPAPFLSTWLEEVQGTGRMRPWPGQIGAIFQEIRSPTLAGWLGLDSPRGILVRRVDQGGSACGVIRKDDVLLSFDGLEIDGDGNIRDPDHGLLWFEVLLSSHHAGDVVPIRVRRDGVDRDLALPLRSYTAASWLIPSDLVGPPAYLVAGGLVFREFDATYPTASSELGILKQMKRTAQTADRRRIVLLSSVLPDPYNLGYQGTSHLPVASVNDRPIDAVRDMVEALEHPVEGFHVIRFLPNPRLNEIVLDAATLGEATTRIAQAYGIPAVYRPGTQPPDLGPACASSESLEVGRLELDLGDGQVGVRALPGLGDADLDVAERSPAVPGDCGDLDPLEARSVLDGVGERAVVGRDLHGLDPGVGLGPL